MSKPQAPDPNGPQPHDWNPRHWIAYSAWATGQTRREAADAAGYSFGHLGRLVAGWRDTYDVSGLNYRTPGFDPDVIERGQQAAAVANRLRWRDRRVGIADDIGSTIDAGHRLLGRLIVYWSDRVEAMEPADIRLLTRSLLDLVKIADQLAEIPDPTRAFVVQQNNLRFGGEGSDDSGVDEGLLDGLLGSGGPPQDLLDALDVIAAGFIESSADVIETTTNNLSAP